MTWDIQFAPLIDLAWVVALAVASALALVTALGLSMRGLGVRAGALLALALTMANPTLRQEDRDPIPDIVAVLADESRSQTIGERTAVTDLALADLEARLARDDSLEVRVSRFGDTDATNLGAALAKANADIPPDRLAGAIVLTDGQIHDVPADGRFQGFDGPVHTLITGMRKEGDRKLTILQAPAFGIVGNTVTVRFRIDDLGTAGTAGNGSGGTGEVTLRLGGSRVVTRTLSVGVPVEVAIPMERPGPNMLEVEVAPGREELTLLNNRAALSINGVRDRLKVLLVSGEPHPGQRTWRNLLKSDPAVDLVHFTILRPPDKQDFTRASELALIEFPTDDLFDTKLDEFDLVIFDRFKRRGVLAIAYLSNVARFVEQGGALLTAAGPAYATPTSLHRTPLSAVLPAPPTGTVIEQGYRPEVTQAGRRHPVTAGLPGAGETNSGEATWGRWFRLIEALPERGSVTMAGPDGRPVLVLDRAGDGRVAQLLSDHAWLWARGFEGGGPQQELLRRLAHWLMKEPELEEEVLTARSIGRTLEIRRRTMADNADPVTVTSPSGAETTVDLAEIRPGLWGTSLETDEIGLFRMTSGDLAAVVAVGSLNSREFEDVRAAAEPMAPVAEASGGGRFWIAETGPQSLSLPALRRARAGREMAGQQWLGLRDNNRYEVRASREVALFPPALLALVLLGMLVAGWRWESR
ncbi:MAG: hypothetical protein ACFB6R_01875 [Alphaproteobacteria bacterium]